LNFELVIVLTIDEIFAAGCQATYNQSRNPC